MGRRQPTLGVTVYRTASGLRVFVSGVEEPTSSARGGQILAEEAAARGYAVCRLLAAHGPAPSTVDERILRLHDERTGVHTTLPLA